MHYRKALIDDVPALARLRREGEGGGGSEDRMVRYLAELQWIYVTPAHRGGQVAAELLHLLAAWFVDHRALRICVNVGDEHAGRFYKRHGAKDLNKYWMVWKDISTVLAAGRGETGSE